MLKVTIIYFTHLLLGGFILILPLILLLRLPCIIDYHPLSTEFRGNVCHIQYNNEWMTYEYYTLYVFHR